MVVDGSEVNLTLFRHLLVKIDGIQPQYFNVSEQALVWCETHGIDLVIVDYMMPAPDGIELIRRLRTLPGM